MGGRRGGPISRARRTGTFSSRTAGSISADQRRYRITAAGRRYRWEEFDERFDAGAHPNEPNRFGWVVEIDPRDPQAAPIKRTALGRMAHEGAACSVGPDGRLTLYMADDWEFEYVYKFVTARAWDPARREANRDLLDEGVLYAARFNPDGSGDWLPLVHGQGALTAATGFADQGAILVRTRQAADTLGATRMDRPEWIVPHPVTREVYCACTGNTARGRDGNEGPNPANPRAPNPFGHLLRWREDGGDPAATRFRWDVFVQAGPSDKGAPSRATGSPARTGCGSTPAVRCGCRRTCRPPTSARATSRRSATIRCWPSDPAVGVFKRFLTGPRGCEITGFHTTPDNRTAFVNIQHPGEVAGDRSNPDAPRALSNWPDYRPDGRPRSATVVIRRRDGGVIGT